MNDLEICKRIAEIEGVNVTNYDGLLFTDVVYSAELFLDLKGKLTSIAFNALLQSSQYNPLIDDALCFQFMVKYKVWRWSNPYCGVFNVCIRGVQGWVTAVTLNKAILLAIIKANKGD